jgi:hypothetical protein
MMYWDADASMQVMDQTADRIAIHDPSRSNPEAETDTVDTSWLNGTCHEIMHASRSEGMIRYLSADLFCVRSPMLYTSTSTLPSYLFRRFRNEQEHLIRAPED